MSIDTFNLFLGVMSLIALFVFIALYFVKAGYGIFRTASWGVAISNKLAWILMEAPVFIVMTMLWWNSERQFETVPLVIFIFFQLHYFQRSFIFPFLMKGKSRMPVTVMLMGVVFNILNGFIQGEWLFYLAPDNRYTVSWLTTPQFIIGTLVFFTGMAINLHSDNVIRHLRKPGSARQGVVFSGNFGQLFRRNCRMDRICHSYLVDCRCRVRLVDICQSCAACRCHIPPLPGRVRRTTYGSS